MHDGGGQRARAGRDRGSDLCGHHLCDDVFRGLEPAVYVHYGDERSVSEVRRKEEADREADHQIYTDVQRHCRAGRDGDIHGGYLDRHDEHFRVRHTMCRAFAAYGLGLIVPRATKHSGIASLGVGTVAFCIWQILSGGDFLFGILPVCVGCAME